MDPTNPSAQMPAPSNPYAAPDHLAIAGSDPRITVEGNLIVGGKHMELPPICVVTGETEDLVSYQKKLTFAPGWVYVGLLINLIVLIILYFAFRKQNSIHYYVSRQVHNKKRNRKLIGVLLLLALIADLVYIVTQNPPQVPELIVVPVTFIASIVFFALGRAPLKIVRHERGERFWIKGSRPPFLAALWGTEAPGW
ncbi:MAG: hypothetical protein KDA85_18010 [Planctomycetaceae bacterium]|nr:hypothetical protein [Planctomycetaceae bacterium]